jgi:MYXO-CTERM domain-containing protein
MDQVVLEPAPDLRAFYPVTVMNVIVGSDPATLKGRTGDPSSPSLTFAAHTGSVCVENGALHRETRTATIRVSADIAGLAESPAPATIDVTVDCGAIKWTSENDYRAAKEDATTPSSSNDDAVPTAGATGGCAAAPAGQASSSAALLVAGATLAGLRRRRASQTRS